jgi:hypothetical protein
MSFEAINCLQKLVFDRLGLQFLAHLKEMSCNNEKWLNSSVKVTVFSWPWRQDLFGSVVVVAFQIAFRAEIHANDVFLFFKNHF